MSYIFVIQKYVVIKTYRGLRSTKQMLPITYGTCNILGTILLKSHLTRIYLQYIGYNINQRPSYTHILVMTIPTENKRFDAYFVYVLDIILKTNNCRLFLDKGT